jgi:CHAT domain-containing protein/predicted negative regulator of RcsB-dependent stress response
MLLAASVPTGVDVSALYQFYLNRMNAADRLGRLRDRIENAAKAVDVARQGQLSELTYALNNLGYAEMEAGHSDHAIQLFEEAVALSDKYNRGARIHLWRALARVQLDLGDVEAARNNLSAMVTLYTQRFNSPGDLFSPSLSATIDRMRGDIALYTGHPDDAITAYRAAVQKLQLMEQRAPRLGTRWPVGSTDFWLAGYQLSELVTRADLARALLGERRYSEAEAELRQSLRDSVAWFGPTAIPTLWGVARLADCLIQQGRVRDAEQLDHVVLSLLEKGGIDPTAGIAVSTALRLGDLLTYQGRWPEAAAVFDRVAATTTDERLMHRQLLDARVTRAVALLKAGRAQEADAVVRERLARDIRLYGENSYNVALARGLSGAVFARMNDISDASQAFQAALPVLLAASQRSGTDSDLVTGTERLRRVVFDEALIFFTRPELRSANTDLGFQTMSAAQAGTVQAAIEANAARAAAPNSALGQLLREDQDLAQLEGAIGRQLANASGTAFEARAAPLRDQLRTIAGRRSAIQGRLQVEFPNFSRLLGTARTSIAEVQAALKPDQALVSVYSNDEGTFIWVIRSGMPPSFAHTRQSEADLQTLVTRVRRGLEFPRDNSVGGIPRFDVAAAQELYGAVLAPVAETWRGAGELIVVPHGAMAQIPWSLLVAEPSALPTPHSSGLRFSEYRSVPWLFRSVSVAHVPSIGAFQVLASEPPSAAVRPFLGVGAPVFRSQQIASAGPSRAMSLDGVPVVVRSPPVVVLRANSLHLSDLQPLPETEGELKDVAQALGADPARDLLLGIDANEQALRKSNPSDRRVMMFATHGLAAGDLDGLMEPALALSSPVAVDIAPDAGLLTMSKILGLKLDADWVVLSACNTAAPSEAGGEAASGLARAFFYAGARSVLLTHWPVASNSARAFTTSLFRNQDSGMRRAVSRAAAVQAAQQHMVDDMAASSSTTGAPAFAYAHPIFWAPFALMGL